MERIISADLAWTPEMNQRRAELIDRKFAIGLTADESAELDQLTTSLRLFLDRVAPIHLDEVHRHHQRLVALADRTELRETY